MSTTDIDSLVTDFYQSVSFKAGEDNDFTYTASLFTANAILVNNSYGKPIIFNPTSFVKALVEQVTRGNLKQFVQRELFSKTEVFGKIAQRASVYEYSFEDPSAGSLPKGVNYVQCILDDEKWLISSMAWSDESDENPLPHEYHIDRK